MHIGALGLILFAFAGQQVGGARATALVSAESYPNLQAAVDANPGQMVFVPNGDFSLSASLRLQTDGSGLYGPGRIVQHNPKQEIVRIDGAKGVRIKDVTLTRPSGAQDATEPGLFAVGCTGLEIDGIRVVDNHAGAGGIRFNGNTNSTIRNCTVQNYKTITLDDRTASPLMGYAFKCIDGTGIVVFESTGTQILNNRILEYNLLPTKENRDKYDLGAVTVLPKVKGILTPADIFETKYTNNWHQGSGLIVSNLGHMRNTIVSGNYIENAAQGMDFHSDDVIISNNIVTHAMIGMKAMHGSKHVLITGNQFTHTDLWGLMLQPGAGSHAAADATTTAPAKEANTDGGTVVANNIFSDFGYGEQAWNWEGKGGEMMKNVIAVLGGQLPENPSIRDVLITGNVISDEGRDGVLVNGVPKVLPPRYGYAIYVEQKKDPKPVNIQLVNNLLHPGSAGITNLPSAK